MEFQVHKECPEEAIVGVQGRSAPACARPGPAPPWPGSDQHAALRVGVSDGWAWGAQCLWFSDPAFQKLVLS